MASMMRLSRTFLVLGLLLTAQVAWAGYTFEEGNLKGEVNFECRWRSPFYPQRQLWRRRGGHAQRQESRHENRLAGVLRQAGRQVGVHRAAGFQPVGWRLPGGRDHLR